MGRNPLERVSATAIHDSLNWVHYNESPARGEYRMDRVAAVAYAARMFNLNTSEREILCHATNVGDAELSKYIAELALASGVTRA